MQKKKNKTLGKVVPLALMVAIVGTGVYGSFTVPNGVSAFFNQKESFAINTKAGTLDLTLTDNTENHNLDPDNDGIINPGDYKPIKLNVANTGEKSMNVRVVLTLKSAAPITPYSIVDSVKLSDNSADTKYPAVESTTALKDATGKNYTLVSETKVDDHTMQYVIDLGVLNGSVETEDGVTKKADDYEFNFYFDRLAKNAYIGDDVTLDCTVYGIQHRNAQASDWDSVITNTTAGGNTEGGGSGSTEATANVQNLSELADQNSQVKAALSISAPKRRLVSASVMNTADTPKTATLQAKTAGASDWTDVASDTIPAATDDDMGYLTIAGYANVDINSQLRIQTEDPDNIGTTGYGVAIGMTKDDTSITLDQEDLSAIIEQAKADLGASDTDTVKTGIVIASDAVATGTVQVEGGAAQDFTLTEDTGNLSEKDYVAPIILDNAENKSITVNKTSGDNLYIYGYAVKTNAENPVVNKPLRVSSLKNINTVAAVPKTTAKQRLITMVARTESEDTENAKTVKLQVKNPSDPDWTTLETKALPFETPSHNNIKKYWEFAGFYDVDKDTEIRMVADDTFTVEEPTISVGLSEDTEKTITLDYNDIKGLIDAAITRDGVDGSTAETGLLLSADGADPDTMIGTYSISNGESKDYALTDTLINEDDGEPLYPSFRNIPYVYPIKIDNLTEDTTITITSTGTIEDYLYIDGYALATK